MNNIEILEEFIEQYNASYPEEKECVAIYPGQIEAIENLIKENKKLKDTNMKMAVNGGSISAKLYIEENYIPKSKIEKALDKMNERYMTPEAISNSNGATFNYWTGKRDMCIELLEMEK